MGDDIVNSAKRLAKLGLPVFPLHGDSKLPAIDEYPRLATTDPKKIELFYRCELTGWVQPYNVGIAMRSFVGIDVDNKKGRDGSGSIFDLEMQGQDFPATFTQFTPTGGIHYVYRLPRGAVVRNTVQVLAPGVDIRGSGGYLVGAGSVIGQVAYTSNWACVSEAPAWLIQILQRRSVDPPKSLPSTIAIDAESARIRAVEYLQNMPGVALGQRNSAAYAHACRLKNIGIDVWTAFELLEEIWTPKCDPPFASQELERPVANGFQYARDKEPVDAPEYIFPVIEDELPKESPVKELNNEYAFVMSGGSHHILWETTDFVDRPCVAHLNELSFHRKLASKTMCVDKKWEPVSRVWMRSSTRRSYDGFCFRPEQKVNPRYYNLWRGFAVQPKKYEDASELARESLNKFFEHALQNVCQNDKELFQWLIGYFAHLVQRPWEKPHVALVFKGEKGVGKNCLIDCIGQLLGSHYLLTADKRYLVGNFNSHLENLLLFTLDEAFWSGEKSIEGILKNLITGSQHVIEHKGKESYTVENCTRIIILGNEEWLVPASHEERRFAVFEVGTARQQDNSFFEAMLKGMRDGGHGILLHYLQGIDLSKVDVNTAPMSHGLFRQKIASLDLFAQWWLDCLRSGTITESDLDIAWPKSLKRTDLRDAFYRYYREHAGKGRLPSDEQCGRILKGFLPTLKGYQPRGEARRYLIPSLADCRNAFATKMKYSINWEEL